MRRSRLETIHEILKLCTTNMKKTHIMYRANLSHLQLEKYLTFPLDKGLLEKTEGQYAITRKGRTYVEEFEKIKAVIGEDIQVLTPSY